jgi:CheY-like chemotaxis protein
MSCTEQRRKLLILDDAPMVAETLALIASRHGFYPAVAQSAEEAIDMITTWEPDTAFIDVILPGMNGIEFADFLKTCYPSCRIVLMSGHPATGELLDAETRNGRSLPVLAKPLDPGEFLEIAGGGAIGPTQESSQSLEVSSLNAGVQ